MPSAVDAALAPAGPLPGFHFRPETGGPAREAVAADWLPMCAPYTPFSADPPVQSWEQDLLTGAPKGKLIPYGPGRLRRQKWSTEAQDGSAWRAIVLPREWKPGDFEAAYARAWRIIRQVGFLHSAQKAWVFRDAHKHWWALHERHGGELVGPDGGPECFAVHLRRQAPGGFLATGALVGGPQPTDLSDAFLNDFGGVYGALHWAFIVAATGRQRLSAVRNLRNYRLRTRALVDRPEWAALRQAMEKDWPKGGGLREVVAVMEGNLWNGPVAQSVSAYAIGFQNGAALAWLQANVQISQSEDQRNLGKVHLRTALRQIAVDEAAKNPPLKPYALAKTLIAEQKNKVARGLALGKLGLASNFNTVGTMIKDEATKAGVL